MEKRSIITSTSVTKSPPKRDIATKEDYSDEVEFTGNQNVAIGHDTSIRYKSGPNNIAISDAYIDDTTGELHVETGHGTVTVTGTLEATDVPKPHTVVDMHRWLNDLNHKAEKVELTVQAQKLNKFRIKVVDMDGYPVRDVMVGVWEDAGPRDHESALVLEHTNGDGEVEFEHYLPSNTKLFIRCRGGVDYLNYECSVNCDHTPHVVSLNFEQHPRHLPGYRSPYV